MFPRIIQEASVAGGQRTREEWKEALGRKGGTEAHGAQTAVGPLGVTACPDRASVLPVKCMWVGS